jgi:predicted phage terminase large subunit-like protein
MAFKDQANSDYVVGQVWGANGADRFLLDQVRRHMDMPATKEAVRALSERWPKAGAKLVEDKANGPAVIQELKHDIPGLIEVQPEGGKVARAHAVSPMIESGNVYLPHPALAPWVEDFIEETAAFPNGRHDDQVDAMTQALNRLRQYGGYQIPEAELVVEPFVIPPGWRHGFGLVVQPNGVAALWAAQSPDGTLFLYAEHECSRAEPGENARALTRQGSWIPGALYCGSNSGSRTTRHTIVEIYRKHGVKLALSPPAEQAAVYEFWQLLAAKKIRVFASLDGFLAAYRTRDDDAGLLRCCHALILSRTSMRAKPAPQPLDHCMQGGPGGPQAWMA